MIHYKVITPGTVEPVSLNQAKNYLKLSEAFGDDDALIQMHITAARERFEKATGMILTETVYKAVFDSWPDDYIIRLFKMPVSAVQSITYYDSAGDQQTIEAASLYFDYVSQPARITHVDGYFPAADGRPGGIVVNFTAGYSESSNVPKLILQALLLMINSYYENRVEVVTGTLATALPLAAEHIIEMYQIREHR